MIYRCRKCNRFIANIKDEKDMQLKGRSITVADGYYVIKCKCGTDNVIKPIENNDKI